MPPGSRDDKSLEWAALSLTASLVAAGWEKIVRDDYFSDVAATTTPAAAITNEDGFDTASLGWAWDIVSIARDKSKQQQRQEQEEDGRSVVQGSVDNSGGGDSSSAASDYVALGDEEKEVCVWHKDLMCSVLCSVYPDSYLYTC